MALATFPQAASRPFTPPRPARSMQPVDERLLHLASLAVLRDIETAAHMFRVGQTSGAIAWWFTGDAAYARNVCIGAPFHDIGKICVAPAILGKPGPLTSQELSEMRCHPEFGARLLQGSRDPAVQIASEIALHHHERMDGAGYPHRLQGHDIPLSARIVAVTDYFDALTRDRCYRSAVAEPEVLDTLQRLAGTQFDPRIVEVLLSKLPELRALAAAVDARAEHISLHDMPRHLFEPLVM